MSVHEAAAQGFDRAADEYERGRPGYPAEAVALLAETFGLRAGASVVDLAAGTGKLTQMLLPTGATVIAVEPVAGMRRKLSELLPQVQVLDGTAEAMPLPDGSVDAVTAGSAFHWFQGEAALAELHRVLRPGGGLGLLWNVRDESVDWIAELGKIIQTHRGDVPGRASGRWRQAFEATTRFTPLQERHFPFEQTGDVETMLARVSSISFIAALPDTERTGMLNQVRELLHTHPQTRGRTTFTLPYRTEVFWCERI